MIPASISNSNQCLYTTPFGSELLAMPGFPEAIIFAAYISGDWTLPNSGILAYHLVHTVYKTTTTQLLAQVNYWQCEIPRKQQFDIKICENLHRILAVCRTL